MNATFCTLRTFCLQQNRRNTTSAFLTTVFTLLVMFSPLSIAQSEQGLGADFWEKYSDIADWITLRLKLTPEQEDKALPILKSNFQIQKEIFKDYGFLSGKKPELTNAQKEELDAKIIAVRASTRVELVSILNESQLEELKKIQREYHEEFRRRLAKN